MGVIDKFLNAMKMNDEEGFEEGYLDDGYDEYEEEEREERPKKRILNRANRDDEEEEQEPQEEQERASSPRPKRSSKISPIRSPRRGNGMEVCVIKPKSMEDGREITETLRADCTVILNMEGIDLDLAQRIIDYSSGSCYALHGTVQKITNYIFVITPESVEISGDFQEILSGAVDVPAFGTRF